jgi:hypothetical protein
VHCLYSLGNFSAAFQSIVEKEALLPIAIPESSLNRLQISPLCPLEEYRGLRGTDLLHSSAIAALKTDIKSFWTVEMARRTAALIFSLLGDRPHWPKEEQHTPSVQDALENIREYWSRCPQISLGGGFLAGSGGPKVLEKAVSFLRCWDIADNRIVLAEQPERMPLSGAAYQQPTGSLVLDFGHGSVKGLWDGQPLPPFSMSIESRHEGTDPTFSHEVLRKVQAALQHFLSLLEGSLPVKLVISLAAYIQKDRFIPTHRGGYCQLAHFQASAVELFAGLWQKLSGQEILTEIYHDGTAAARPLPPGAATILFGTALGHGFAPD